MQVIQDDHYTIKDLESLADEELIQVYRKGTNEAIEVLIQRYKRFVRTKIRTNYYVGTDKDDLIQEGMIGLFKAICDYNPNKEASFKSFATICITRQLSTVFKSVTRQKHIPLNTSISLSIPVNTKGSDEEEDGITLMDVLKNKESLTPEDEVIDRENLEVLNKNISKVLSPMEWHVLKLYIDGKNYKDIALMLGKKPKSIDNALQRIKKKVEAISM